MARYIYCPEHPDASANGFVTSEVFYSWKYRHLDRSEAPNYISDHMAPTRHMADGQMYDSKAAFRRATKVAGCIEIGNETATVLKPKPRIELDRRERRDAIKRTIWELKNGRPPVR